MNDRLASLLTQIRDLEREMVRETLNKEKEFSKGEVPGMDTARSARPI